MIRSKGQKHPKFASDYLSGLGAETKSLTYSVSRSVRPSVRRIKYSTKDPQIFKKGTRAPTQDEGVRAQFPNYPDACIINIFVNFQQLKSYAINSRNI